MGFIPNRSNGYRHGRKPRRLVLRGGAVCPGAAGEVNTAGFVTDASCGRKGANAQHADHARRTVASGVA
ncbi:MAG: hypothetical protein ACRD6I_05035, partial [Candidatus Acidiferrales bacterium]